MLKRFSVLLTSMVMLINLLPTQFVSAETSINIGDYIEMGTYYGKPILWRCVDIDENGPLMLSDRILCLKAFDASGDNTTGSHSRGYNSGECRKKCGSNYWSDSNIRCWLNSKESAGNVVWTCGNPPDSSHVRGGYNSYDNEAGFLTNFSNSELTCIKEVTQDSLLDRYEYSDVSLYGSTYHSYNSSISNVVQNAKTTAYRESVTDKMFLLDVNQINKVYQNASKLGGNNYCIGIPTDEAVENSEYKDSSLTPTDRWMWLLRSPYVGGDGINVRGVSTTLFEVYDDHAYKDIEGIRPAFYLNLSSLNLKSGRGTADEPYKVGESEEISPNVTINNVRSKAGKTVEMTVSLSNNSGFSNLGLEVGYNSDVMTLTGATSLVTGASFTTAQEYSANPYNLQWDSAADNTYNGDLVKLTFTINENAKDGTYPVTVDFYKGRNGNNVDGNDVNYNAEYDALRLSYVNGELTVYSYIPGDINGDEVVNNKDATTLLRYFANWEDIVYDEDALDVNGDSSVNNKDATHLLRYFAGWGVELH